LKSHKSSPFYSQFTPSICIVPGISSAQFPSIV
jgi:hypothetical protein